MSLRSSSQQPSVTHTSNAIGFSRNRTRPVGSVPLDHVAYNIRKKSASTAVLNYGEVYRSTDALKCIAKNLWKV